VNTYTISFENLVNGDLEELWILERPRFTSREYKLVTLALMDILERSGKRAKYLTAFVYDYDMRRKDCCRPAVLRFDLNAYEDITNGSGCVISAEICEHAVPIRRWNYGTISRKDGVTK